MPLFEALATAAGLATRNPIKVSVSARNAVPEMRAGTVYLPSDLVPMLREGGRGPIIFVQTFVHELQHAVDYHDPASADWSRDQWEERARAAERILSDSEALVLVRQHLE
jgi:hypothetical protein